MDFFFFFFGGGGGSALLPEGDLSRQQEAGSALQFLTEEPSTCFTPNFQSAESLQSLPTDGGMREIQDRQTVDFEFVTTEEQSMQNALQE